MKLIAGIDIGGTQTRCALALKGTPADFLFKTSFPTPQDEPETVIKMAANCIRDELEPNQYLDAVGCVAPGMTDTESGLVLRAANLNGWINFPLRSVIEDQFKVQAAIENDVNAAAIAETNLSKTPDCSPVVFMTISTGIAAGILIDGKILRGANYSAGEIGGLIPSPTCLGKSWQPGGCTERLAGGIGLASQWARLRGGTPDSMRAIEVFEAADAGDHDAAQMVATALDYIAQAAIGLACIIDPAVIILGGSIGRARPELALHIRQELAHAVASPPSVRLSFLGDDAPLLGALALAGFLSGGREGFG